MGTKAMAKTNDRAVRIEGGLARTGEGQKGLARSAQIADNISSSRDFANFFSTLIGDIVNGRIDVQAASAACKAGANLLKILEMERKYNPSAKSAKERKLEMVEE